MTLCIFFSNWTIVKRNKQSRRKEKDFNDSHGRRKNHLDMYGRTNLICRERNRTDDEIREKEKKYVHISVNMNYVMLECSLAISFMYQQIMISLNACTYSQKATCRKSKTHISMAHIVYTFQYKLSPNLVQLSVMGFDSSTQRLNKFIPIYINNGFKLPRKVV